MVTVIKNSEYYRQLEASMMEEIDIVHHYASKMEFWRKFSNEAYKKGGFWIVPSLFGGLVCRYYTRIAKRRVEDAINTCLNEMAGLIKYICENQERG